jgi:acyl-CoA synthetase (AMP-forming)/AMP-acid ligase II
MLLTAIHPLITTSLRNLNPIDVIQYPSVHSLIKKMVEIYPNKEAIFTDGAEGHTYTKLWWHSVRLSQYFLEQNIVTGARVVILGTPSFETITSIIALWSIGAVVITIDDSFGS